MGATREGELAKIFIFVCLNLGRISLSFEISTSEDSDVNPNGSSKFSGSVITTTTTALGVTFSYTNVASIQWKKKGRNVNMKL